jgi:hypothetical protein
MHSLSSQALSEDQKPAFNRPLRRLFWGVSRHPVSNTSTPKKLFTQFVKGHKSIPSPNQWIPSVDTEQMPYSAKIFAGNRGLRYSSCETLIKAHKVDRHERICRPLWINIAGFYGAMAMMPQGPVPALICLMTLSEKRSTSVTSFEGPFAE